MLGEAKDNTPYEGWDTKSNFKWEIDIAYDEQMTSMYSILTAWKAKRVEGSTTVSIRNRHIPQALVRIAHSVEKSSNAPRSTKPFKQGVVAMDDDIHR